MKIMLIDDELAMQMIMKRMLGTIEDVEVVGSFYHTMDALTFIQKERVDIVFVDIRIADESGLELARQLRALQNELEIVFVTSHREYAMDAFDIYPLDYMVKPVSKQRLVQTIERVKKKQQTAAARTAKVDPLMVKTFGSFEVYSGQQNKVKFISKKSQELFAYLLLGQGRAVSKSRIIEDVFPDMPVENAAKYLNTAVYQLRKALEPHGYKSIIHSSAELYTLDLDPLRVDFVAFEAFIRCHKEWEGAAIQQAIEWERSYSGDLFEDKPYLWSITERERFTMLHLEFAKKLIEWLMKHERSVESIPIAKKIVDWHEIDIDANFLLLKGYAQSRQMLSLQQHLEHFLSIYQEEIGSLPPKVIMNQFLKLKKESHL